MNMFDKPSPQPITAVSHGAEVQTSQSDGRESGKEKHLQVWFFLFVVKGVENNIKPRRR